MKLDMNKPKETPVRRKGAMRRSEIPLDVL